MAQINISVCWHFFCFGFLPCAGLWGTNLKDIPVECPILIPGQYLLVSTLSSLPWGTRIYILEEHGNVLWTMLPNSQHQISSSCLPVLKGASLVKGPQKPNQKSPVLPDSLDLRIISSFSQKASFPKSALAKPEWKKKKKKKFPLHYLPSSQLLLRPTGQFFFSFFNCDKIYIT